MQFPIDADAPDRIAPSLPSSFTERLQTPAVRGNFTTEDTLADYCQSLLRLPLDGEPMSQYYVDGTAEFRIRETPFPSLQELNVDPAPGELYYSPTPGQKLAIEITGPRERSNPPRPVSYPARHYYRSIEDDGPNIRTIMMRVPADRLVDEYVPVPARTYQQGLNKHIDRGERIATDGGNLDTGHPVTPYPTTDDGELDHEAALRKMFGREPTNMNPVYINDGIRTLAVYQYDPPEAVKIASVECAVDRQTWNVDVIDLWLNWVDGSLTFRHREFHTPSSPSES